ncbi:hypothetical protein BD779DRAFT_1798013 [Infundibulicybe gibba]|nr:hypothetical protein BD779DRAFT_1798013 [Infundibulicybe gibba]
MQGPRNMDRGHHAPVSLRHNKSTKQLINRFEALNSNQIPNSRIIGRARLAASNSSKAGPTLTSQKQKLDKLPIRESLRNLLSVFKKGKPRLDLKPKTHEYQDTGLPEVSRPTNKEQLVPPRFSGPLWYLPSELSLDHATPHAWVNCMVTLEGGRLSISAPTDSMGAIPMLHIVSLSHCTDVRSLAPNMNGEEYHTLPTHNEGEDLKFFEILFEGRAREKFAAYSNHKRADWISAIWDVVLLSRSIQRSGDPRGSDASRGLLDGKLLDNKTPAISGHDPARHIKTTPLCSERDLPPVPSHGTINEPNSQLEALPNLAQTSLPLSPGVYPSGPVLRGSCAQLCSATPQVTPGTPCGDSYIDPGQISKIIDEVAACNKSGRSTYAGSLLDSHRGDLLLQDDQRLTLNPSPEDPRAIMVADEHVQRIHSGEHRRELVSRSSISPSQAMPLLVGIPPCDQEMTILGQQLAQVLEHGFRRLPQEITSMIQGPSGPPALPQIRHMLSEVCKWTLETDKAVTAIQERLTSIEMSGRQRAAPNEERSLPVGDTEQPVVALARVNSKLDRLLAFHNGNPDNCGMGCTSQLEELTGILKAEHQQRELQTQQQADSVRYLNELNTAGRFWLESFVNNGISQIQTLSAGIEEFRKELGCSNGLPNGGEDVLAEIQNQISQINRGHQSLATLQPSVDRLLGFLNTETRTSLTADQVVGMFQHQRQEYEALLRISTTELSNEIKGERLRFVEAMQAATAINVQNHVEQFKKELSREVLVMTREVGRLHQERQNVENQIADLFAFYSKQKQAGAVLDPSVQHQQLAQAPSQVFESYAAQCRPLPEPRHR